MDHVSTTTGRIRQQLGWRDNNTMRIAVKLARPEAAGQDANGTHCYRPLDLVHGAVHVDVFRAASVSRIVVSLEGRESLGSKGGCGDSQVKSLGKPQEPFG